ncbi:hypothetical protein O1611_g227 [Lasiodiplodia mahajangana]|uniref:Uncharacterized protein n=1 Tax=Lasiodiplodia mahajangana TaxID=1108764 RepID=A0ACC2K150_9PEZI|nr:hypothetical protein O1611_g227 [Lasiodiplodia mahajangana]
MSRPSAAQAIAIDHKIDRFIFKKSKLCDNLFKERLSTLPEEAKERYQRIEEQYLRFRRWAAYFGAMARPASGISYSPRVIFFENLMRSEASLDSRLKSVPKLRDWFLNLLNILEENLREDIESDAKSPTPLLEMNAAPHTCPEDIVSIYTVTLEGITESINRIHRLGNTIRKSSIAQVASGITTFVKSDGDEDEFVARMNLAIVKGLYPDISNSFAEHLAESISLRRKQMLLENARYQVLTTRRSEPSQQHNQSSHETEIPTTPKQVIAIKLPGVNESRPRPTTLVLAVKMVLKRALTRVLKQTREIPSNGAPGAPNANSSIRHRYRTGALRLLLNWFNTEEKEVTTCSRIAAPRTNKNLYPRVPEWSNGSQHCQCEWCLEDIPYTKEKDQWQAAWETHFKRDLRPYICISERCGADPEYFASLQEWRKHMDNIHSPEWTQDIFNPYVWYCDDEHEEVLEFKTSLDLRKHIMEEHDYDQKKREWILGWNVIPMPRRPTECPFCGYDVIIEDSSQHVGLSALSTDPPKVPNSENIDASIRTELDTKTTALTEQQHVEAQHQKLVDHIASHLESLALVSLRYFDDEVGSVDSNETTLGVAEKDLSGDFRGRHYFELRGSLVFEDPVPESLQLAREQSEPREMQG